MAAPDIPDDDESAAADVPAGVHRQVYETFLRHLGSGERAAQARTAEEPDLSRHVARSETGHDPRETAREGRLSGPRSAHHDREGTRGEREIENFKAQLKMVFPEHSLEELPRTHEIFKCFYDISNLLPPPPYARSFIPQYLGMSDDKQRLMMVVDYNNDISEYWEWSNDPFMPIEETNEAYKYGVNYVVYALTH